MTHAVRIHSNGGPEVLRWEEVALPEPGRNEVIIRQTASGLNFIDVYFRTGLYKVPSFPATIGNEGAGVVEAVGVDVTEVAVADWMRVRAPHNAVVLEAPGRASSGASRISTWTGIPTVVGWTQHQELWRGAQEQISVRVAAVDLAYKTNDLETLRAVFDRYGVRHVIFGDSERRRYGEEAEARFHKRFSAVFKVGKTSVFEVNQL